MPKRCPNADCPERRDLGRAGEYRNDVVLCPLCGATLAGEADHPAQPGPVPTETVPLVTIAQTANAVQAHLIRGALEARGIPAFLFDENVVRLNWFWANAIGAIKVKVPADLAEQARDALAEDTSTDAPDAERRHPDCPKCGSSRVHRMLASPWSLATVPLGPGLLLPTSRHACEECGHSWIPDPPCGC
ncbi:MAG: DUF2007 domain-containing protein [Acidobacteria bacterium]|nr:DUF2007 domain-containing protein [Acidobacteriota bacterium]